MNTERDVAINARVSAPAAARLKQLATRQGKSYGEVLTALILALPVEAADWQAPLCEAMGRIAAMEARLAALEAATAPQQGGGLLPHQSGEIGGYSAAEGGLQGQGIDAPVGGEESPASDGMEGGSDIPSHPVPSVPTPARSIRDVIAELAQQGHGPQSIADKLNLAGYRTSNGTLIQRGYVNNTLKRLGV